jgi:hypothetical protein
MSEDGSDASIDDNQSDMGGGSSSHMSCTNAEGSSNSSTSLARSETRRVTRSKMVVLLVISLAASAFGILTYFFVQGEETNNFEAAVRSSCSTLYRARRNMTKSQPGALFPLPPNS